MKGFCRSGREKIADWRRVLTMQLEEKEADFEIYFGKMIDRTCWGTDVGDKG